MVPQGQEVELGLNGARFGWEEVDRGRLLQRTCHGQSTEEAQG